MFSADTDFWVASQHLEALETTVSADDFYIASQQVLYSVLCTLYTVLYMSYAHLQVLVSPPET